MSSRRAYSVAVYPRHAGRVLVIRHRRLGVWLPPGGECNPDETPLEAAARELREETGLVGRFPTLSHVVGTPPGLIGYEEHPAGSKGTHLNFVFVVDVDSRDVTPNEEFDEWRWVDTTRDLDAPDNVDQLAQVALAARSIEDADGDTTNLGVARAWLAAFAAKDLDALVALYETDAVHESPKLRVSRPETEGRVVGRAALRAWWGDAFARLPALRYEAVSLTASRDRVWMEYLRHLPGEPTLRVAEVLEVRAGRIFHSRVFHG